MVNLNVVLVSFLSNGFNTHLRHLWSVTRWFGDACTLSLHWCMWPAKPLSPALSTHRFRQSSPRVKVMDVIASSHLLTRLYNWTWVIPSCLANLRRPNGHYPSPRSLRNWSSPSPLQCKVRYKSKQKSPADRSSSYIHTEIDHNFSQAHRIVTTSILPLVEQYTEHSRDVWEGSKVSSITSIYNHEQPY